MRVISRKHLFLWLCAASLTQSHALAADRPQPPGPAPREGTEAPPQQPLEAAFAACADLKRDDVCEVEVAANRTIQGQCVPARDEARLQCVQAPI